MVSMHERHFKLNACARILCRIKSEEEFQE